MPAEFTCNLCGGKNRMPAFPLHREAASCSSCGSNIRTRGLLHALSLELFGVALAVPDFPRVRSLRGLGTSDANQYAALLSAKFDYRNTFFDRKPRFDIAAAPEEESGRYDFLISSEVFEHVMPPVSIALANARRMLAPSGVMVFTVPYSLEDTMLEHYPGIHEFGFARVGGQLVLVNRTRAGELQVFEKPVFHCGSDGGQALEMREFTEAGLREALAVAGFTEIRFYGEDVPEFGIVCSESWSLPVAVRNGPSVLGAEPVRDIVTEWRDLKLKFNAEMAKFNRSYWFRLGRKLGLL